MEGRRTRGRQKRNEDTEVASVIITRIIENENTNRKRSLSNTTKRNPSPGRRASPGRTRRSSRPSSSAAKTAPSSTTIIVKPAADAAPSPIKEATESPSPKLSSKTRIPTALGSNITLTDKISPKPAAKSTSSVHSTYSSSSTHKTLEIRSTVSALDTEISKLTDYIRRSVSKSFTGNKREGTHTPTTNTEAGSRYSRSVSRSVYDDDNYSKAEFSDVETNGHGDDNDDTLEEENYKSFNLSAQHSYSTSALGKNCRQLEVPREFGGLLGATLLMIITPCIVYYLQWCCQKNKCNFKKPNFENVFNSVYLLKSLFRSEAVVAYIAFQMGVFVCSGLLFGQRVRLCTDRIGGGFNYNTEYTFNVLSTAILMTLLAGVAEYLHYPVADFLLQHQLQFCFYGFVNAFVVALWAYIRADVLKVKTNTQVNIYGKTGNFLIDYAQGRQLNPKWLDIVDFKQVFYRVALLLTLLYAECYMYKQLVLPGLSLGERSVWNMATYFYQNIRYDPASLLTTGMLLIYVLDAITFEHHLASSFELQGEGFGCLLLLRYAATPYLLTAVARYFFEQQFIRQSQVITPLACQYAGYLSIALLLAGITLKRISNAMKYKYRLNPTKPYFIGIDTIHTFQGRRLLLGGLWGKVRQPNYAGDLMALCSLALPIFLRFAWPPLICVIILCAVLLHRTKRVNARNMSRYHSSWVRYCNQVRYYVLPHVY